MGSTKHTNLILIKINYDFQQIWTPVRPCKDVVCVYCAVESLGILVLYNPLGVLAYSVSN